jgi:metal-responsive CopG/Arc/MetJ family transcriptional regulator
MNQFSENTTAVHMLLPSNLVEELDQYRTRYVSRTQHVAIAIEDYLKRLEASGVAKKDKKNSWSLFAKK